MTNHPPHSAHAHTHGQAIPGFDLTRQYAALQADLEPAVLATLRSTKYIMGEKTKELECELAGVTEAKFVYGCGNGSDAIVLALQAVGVGHGDEVIVPAYSFFATAGSVVRLGATPIFVDVREDTFCLDASLVEAAITPRTRAIMPVHLFGQMAAMREITAIARKHKLRVIADAAQAIGARYDGKPVTAWCDVATYSFFPTKNLGAAGDAGLVATDDPEIAKNLAILRVHGAPRQYHHELVGMNSRMDEVQATVLLVKLPHLKLWQARRAAIARRYNQAFAAVSGVIVPTIDPAATMVWHQYTLRVPSKRDALRAALAEQGIGTMLYYPTPLTAQPCFADLGAAESCPVATSLCEEAVSLPIFPELTDEEVERVVAAITHFLTD